MHTWYIRIHMDYITLSFVKSINIIELSSNCEHLICFPEIYRIELLFYWLLTVHWNCIVLQPLAICFRHRYPGCVYWITSPERMEFCKKNHFRYNMFHIFILVCRTLLRYLSFDSVFHKIQTLWICLNMNISISLIEENYVKVHKNVCNI